MSTYRELIYMSKDLLKLKSDDSYYTNEHILFLLDKVRAVILEQKYKKNNSKIEDSNTQTICVELESKLLGEYAEHFSSEELSDFINTFEGE